MDLKLVNGDFVLSQTGRPVTVEDISELVQKIFIAFTVPRESFIYDRRLGAFKTSADLLSVARMEMLLNEALIDTELTVRILSADSSSLSLLVDDSHRIIETEVNIGG